jgi:hypothetical protein
MSVPIATNPGQSEVSERKVSSPQGPVNSAATTHAHAEWQAEVLSLFEPLWRVTGGVPEVRVALLDGVVDVASPSLSGKVTY